MNARKDFRLKEGNTALTAVALQDHLVKSLGLSDVIGPQHVGLGPGAKAKQKKNIKATIDSGRFGRNKLQIKKTPDKEREYVLDPKPPPLTLAQKFGLVDAPDNLLSEADWMKAKQKSNARDDSQLPCVICKEDFGTQEQVLLSCTHVFHRACLQAFERFTGKKSCPMCRKEQYQTRVIHEGSRFHKHKCATKIQACWRGYIVRCWYSKLRESNPPKDPKLRKKFYEEKLHNITDRMVRSCDFDVHSFLCEMDRSLEASRNVFRDFDTRFQQISEDEWDKIQLKAVERGATDCPICLTTLVSKTYMKKSPSSLNNNLELMDVSSISQQETSINTNILQSGKNTQCYSSRPHKQVSKQCDIQCTHNNQSADRKITLLSCSHVFHDTCLQMFEELNMEVNKVCPVCRSKYQKR